MRAQLIDSKTAREYGLVDELVTPAQVVPRALEVAEELGRLPRDAYARIKHQLRAEAIAQGERIVAEHLDPLLEGWLSPETPGAASAILASEGERSRG